VLIGLAALVSATPVSALDLNGYRTRHRMPRLAYS
jgi:hypothetical protein